MRRYGIVQAGTVLLLFVFTLLLTTPHSPAQEGRGRRGPEKGMLEYKFLLKVINAEGSGSGKTVREISLSATDRPSPQQTGLHFGSKVPIPATTYGSTGLQDESGHLMPVTTYTYQTVGLELEVRPVQESVGRVFVFVVYELSFVENPEHRDLAPDEADANQPVILSNRMANTISFKPGDDVVVAEFFHPREIKELARSIGLNPAKVGNEGGPWRLVMQLLPR